MVMSRQRIEDLNIDVDHALDHATHLRQGPIQSRSQNRLVAVDTEVEAHIQGKRIFYYLEKLFDLIRDIFLKLINNPLIYTKMCRIKF